jgi:hypothetical protein
MRNPQKKISDRVRALEQKSALEGYNNFLFKTPYGGYQKMPNFT